jgi:hypothetical protein
MSLMLPRGEIAGRSASEIAGRNPPAAQGQSACCSQCINSKRIIIILQPCSTLDYLHCFATPIVLPKFLQDVSQLLDMGISSQR